MGFFSRFKSASPKPLKITKMDRRLRRDSGIVMIEEKEDYQGIDLHPTLIEDKYYVELKSQKLMLEFDVMKTNRWYQFQLVNTVHMGRYREFINVRAEQILIPLIALTGIDIDDGILHYTKSDQFHLRIASRHMDSIWTLDQGVMNIFGRNVNCDQWMIEVTDHRYWSTN